jgi:DNA-binding MarR family transcriptional regulator
MAESAHGLPPTDYSNVNYGLASELRVVVGRIVRRLRSDRKYGLTQVAVLGRLDRQGPQPTGQLAKREGVRPQSMSQTVAELEAAGLVTRSADASDGRRSLVALTDAGRAVLHEDRAEREGYLAELINDRLNDEERELLTRAVDLLRRISDV